MHELEQLIADWRKTVVAEHNVGHESIDELETHLRENVEQLLRSGMTESQAFERAVTQLGDARMIASEFGKLQQRTWLPVKLVAGFGVALTLALVVFLIGRLDCGRLSLLMAAHVFAVTLGYTITLLVGALGMCFVGQRCFSDFSGLRMPSVTRASFVLGCIAAALTTVGIILGMVWAKAEWGRYWAWDAKETGAFAVILWQVFFLIAHRFAFGTARGILTLSLFGNIVVSLGWFGANLLSLPNGNWALHNLLILLIAVVSHLGFFFVGLAPAGWLRTRKTG
jgi:hypothetical protein